MIFQKLEHYIPEALLLLFTFCFVVQMCFLLIQQRRFAAYKVPDVQIQETAIPVSVIISARNEAENLSRFLPAILAQNYHKYEVVVINDCSTDQSDLILLNLSENHPHLKLVTVTEHRRFKTGKKFALTMGIKAATYEHLIFTDADCEPASPQWVARMAANFTGETEIVLGYSPYIRARGFINAFTRYETLKTAINYLSAALGRNAYMGIGRNLAYTKSLFFKNKGFASHLHVMAGDDDLFVNKNATPKNTVIEVHPETFMFTEAKSKIGAYYRQKKRHMGVGALYRGKHRFALSLEAMTGFLFYVALGFCVYFQQYPIMLAGAYLVRMVTQLVVYYISAKKLTGKDLLWLIPFFDLFYYLYLNIFGLIGTFIKTTQWK